MIEIQVRNESSIKRMYRTDVLTRLAQRIYGGERPEYRTEDDAIEVSVLFCDNPFIAKLNHQYLNKNRPTNVLSFPMGEEDCGAVKAIGDIVISLETVARFCANHPAKMRNEIKLLFCHGMLHLLGYDHRSQAEEKEMQRKQAHYLGIDLKAAWHREPGNSQHSRIADARGGARNIVGRRK